jgi:hypothetical protein
LERHGHLEQVGWPLKKPFLTWIEKADGASVSIQREEKKPGKADSSRALLIFRGCSTFYDRLRRGVAILRISAEKGEVRRRSKCVVMYSTVIYVFLVPLKISPNNVLDRIGNFVRP